MGADAARAAWATRWHLAVASGPDPGWCHPVLTHEQVVGRDSACDLSLADPWLSRRHLEFRERHRGVEVRDLGSANGSTTRSGTSPGRRPRRGARLGRQWRLLAPGSEVLLGRTVLQVRGRPGLAAAPPPEREPRESEANRSDQPPLRVATSVLLAASSLPLLLVSGMSGGRLALLLIAPAILLALTVLPLVRARLRGRRVPPEDAPTDPAWVLLQAVTGPGAEPRARPPHETAHAQDGPDLSAHVPGAGWLNPIADGPLAVVGEPEIVRAVARSLLCRLAVRLAPAALAIRVRRDSEAGADRVWDWLSLLPHSARSDEAGGLTLSVRDVGDVAETGRDDVVLVATLAQVPSWCRRIVEVSPGAADAVSPGWARAVAYLLAARHAPAPARDASVSVADLVADPDTAWAADDGGLVARFLVGEAGPVDVDLASDGPHALVAGTTGSGKSELLLAWLIALACRYPPSALSVVAFDYKGGATFGAVTGLPHVAGVLTDLDAHATARALAGLRAELRRRERLLAAAGARDITTYRRLQAQSVGTSEPIGRLLVMVDEFRELADEHPDLLAGLVRLAAQGRSLGIHLVLATQRPAGAISADMRANLRLTICLRVVSPADSLDVLGSTRAAHLPTLPGYALVDGLTAAVGRPAPPLEVRAAWSGPDPGGLVARTVAQVRAAAARRGEHSAPPLWASPLPEQVQVADISPSSARPARTEPEGAAPGPAGAALPFLLLDRPDEQRHAPWSWEPSASPLIVAGGRRSGRTTALLSLATAALDVGLPVHLAGGVSLRAARGMDGGVREHPRLGTVVDTDDPRRLARLLDVLCADDAPALLCLDDVDAVVEACARLGRPAMGTDVLAEVLGNARPGGLAVAIAGPPSSLSARWVGLIRYRLVLGPRDAGEALVAGVPRALRSARWPPGRGVLLGTDEPVVAQVLLPRTPRPQAARSEDEAGFDRTVRRLAPVPVRVHPADLETASAGGVIPKGTIPLGVGGDDGGVVRLDVRPDGRMVIAGPPDSGRTNAIAWVKRGLEGSGRSVVALGRDSRVDDAIGAGTPHAVVIDDAESLPDDVAELAQQWWRSLPGVCVAAVRSDVLATAYRGLPALLREARSAVVLAPLRGGSAHLPPSDVLPHGDPARPRAPGRGVLVEPRRSIPLQLPLVRS